MSKKNKASGLKVGGTALVLPAGSAPLVGNIEAGVYELEVLSICKAHPILDENGDEIPQEKEVLEAQAANPRSYVEVKYPDGFIREHHVLDMPDLVQKIVNNLRARHGTEAVKILEAKDLAVGTIIKVEV